MLVRVKLVFLVIMLILSVVIFVTPLFFPENKSKNGHAQRIRSIVRIRMGCFLGILVLLLLCVIL